jgi:hypothetical protein
MKKITLFVKYGAIFLLFALLSLDLSAKSNQPNPLPQFLFPKFAKGIVKMKAGNIYTASLNYNMIDEEMIFEQKGQFMSLDKPEEIDTVFLQNRIFVPFKAGFYEILNSGGLTFFIQYKSKYVSTGTATAYGLTSQVNAPTTANRIRGGNQMRTLDLPDNVSVTTTIVNWVRKNGAMEDFTNQKQFIKIFPDKEKEISEFFKTEKLNLKVREDVKKLAVFSNGLYK